MNDIGLDDWDFLITNEFKKKIIDEFDKFHIIVEADMQASISRMFREYIYQHQNNRWRVYNQPYLKIEPSKPGIYPDIIMTRKEQRLSLIHI